MSQILLRRLAGGGHYRRLSSAAGGGALGPQYGGERRQGWPRQDEEDLSKAVKVSVWWDFENCNLPNGVNVCRLAPRVTAALRAAGIRGPLSITAFGDVVQLARSAQEALAATGVSISHVPRSGKNSSDRSFLADLVYWISQNPPPAHFFLISGDKDFANVLHRLRMSNYNVLLACPACATSVLCSAATIMWPWEALVKGVGLSPKYFNHPPDGLSGSWYGHYKGPLDNPFIEAPTDSVEAEEQIVEPSGSKQPPVPKYIVDGIRQALSSYPGGVNLSILRGELKKNNVHLGIDFFGYKKFSCLLQSMPDIVKFITLTGDPSVVGVNKRVLNPAEQSSKTLLSAQSNARDNNLIQATHNNKTPPSSVSTFCSEENSNSETLDSSQSIVKDKNFMKTGNKNPPKFSVSPSQSDLPSSSTSESNAQPESSTSHKVVEAKSFPGVPSSVLENTADNDPSSSVLENTADNDGGLFRRIWILWNGPETARPDVSPRRDNTSAEVVDDLRTTKQDHNVDQHRNLLNWTHKTSSQNGSSDATDSAAAVTTNVSNVSKDGHSEMFKSDLSNLQNSKTCIGPSHVLKNTAEKFDGTSKKSVGLFSWATGWWKFGKSDEDNCTTKENGIDVARTNSIEESKSFKASTSRSGQQEDNAMFTKPYLWDILEQQLSKPFGSELVSKAKSREELTNGLQKLDCWPLKGLSKKDLNQLVHLLVSEKKWIEEIPSRYFPFRLILPQKRTCVPSNSSKPDGLSSLFSNVKTSQQGKYVGDKISASMSLTREDILSDCHNLLKELLLQHEYGFTVGIFKRHFAQKHGYELDHEKLGYPDLKSMLQIMPGVRIKFPCVLPAEDGNDHPGSKGNGNQSNGEDFTWEELGPVTATSQTAEGVDKEMCYRPPTLSDDESSEDDNHASTQPRRDAQQSSLLEIIGSWNSSKEDDRSKKSQEIDGLVDCSRNSPGHHDNPVTASAQKPTRVPPPKQYSFVSDNGDEDKDELVSSVLGSLQKARGSKLHN